MTPTPNPTAERLRELVANLIPLDLIHDRDRLGQPQDAFEAADRIIDALRARNLLSEGAPSEEQIERGARAFYAAAWLDKDAGLNDDRTAPEMVKDGVRAALTAAGVAPQEPTLCVECGETEVHGKPEHRVLCMDCAYETGVHAGRSAPTLDPEKVSDELLRLMRDEAMLFDNGTDEWISESDPVECLPPLARALCEAAKRGELT